ncbi:MAG: hypothetical protein HFG48_01515 [Bacilli bacterium]|nr:hypothetical protein [Bacilli bacterium]
MNDGFSMTVNTDDFMALASNVKGYGQELSVLANKYLTEIQTMRESGAWQSPASLEYVNKCSEFKQRVEQLNGKIDALSLTMNESAQSIAEAEASNVAKANSLLQ